MSRTGFLVLLLLLAGPVADSAFAAMEHRYLYFPEKTIHATPAAVGLPFEEVLFPAADGVQLHGWFLPGAAEAPVILFCHGNAGNISHRLESLRLLRQELGVAVFIFDYRGYGRSAGRATEEGTYADARGALAWLQGRGWPLSRTIFFGESLGAAVALQLAVESPPAALVLEAPFTSIAAMGWHHYPVLYALLGWAFQARYDNLGKIADLRAPLLILQGDRDDIVPPAMAAKLFARAAEPKTYVLIPGAGHNDTFDIGGRSYWDAWRKFLGGLPPRRL